MMNVYLIVVTFICGCISFAQVAVADKDAKIEVFEPFPRVLEGERWVPFVKVSNTGNEPIELMHTPEDYQFFIEPTASELSPYTIALLPIPRVENADWEIIQNVPDKAKLILQPGEFFVYGQEGLGGVEGLYGLPLRRVSQYKVHLLIGDKRWVSSEPVDKPFAIKEGIWDESPFAEVDLSRKMVLKAPIRIIEIDGIKWAFVGRSRRCIIPEGASPVFSVDSNADNMFVDFEGSDEERVVCDNGNSNPISGSKRTVPHLYLWQSLTTRPLGIVGEGFVPERDVPKVEEDPPLGGEPVEVAGPKSEVSPLNDSISMKKGVMIVFCVGAIGMCVWGYIERNRRRSGDGK